jgi:hypothetical protein
VFPEVAKVHLIMPGVLEAAVTRLLAQIRKESNELSLLVQETEEYKSETVAIRRAMDCVLFLTPLSTIAMANLVYFYFKLLCVPHGKMLDHIYSLCVLGNCSFCIVLAAMWTCWWSSWTAGDKDLYDRYILSKLLQGSKLASSVALVAYVLASGGTFNNAVPMFYITLILLLNIVSALRTSLSNWSPSNFLRSALADDTISGGLSSAKIVALLMLGLDLYKYHGIHKPVDFLPGAVMIALCMLHLCCGSGWDIFRYKHAVLTVYILCAFSLVSCAAFSGDIERCAP